MHVRSIWASVPAAAVALVLSLGSLQAHSAGQRVTEARSVAEFEAIDLEGPISLTVRQTERQRVYLDADAGDLAQLETQVESRKGVPTLVIRFERGLSSRWRNEAVKIEVDVPRLSALAASGASAVDIGPLATPALKVSVAGSGDVRLTALETQLFAAAIAGSGDVSATGKATQVKLSIAGSGDADLLGLVADAVKVSIAGSGDAQVTADRELAVSIAGSGDVRYAGQVSSVKSSIAGSGSVRRR